MRVIYLFYFLFFFIINIPQKNRFHLYAWSSGAHATIRVILKYSLLLLLSRRRRREEYNKTSRQMGSRTVCVCVCRHCFSLLSYTYGRVCIYDMISFPTSSLLLPLPPPATRSTVSPVFPLHRTPINRYTARAWWLQIFFRHYH